jgi:two-component sensor histidine kinase
MKRFLVVDDEENNPEKLHMLLRKHGYSVTEAIGEAGGAAITLCELAATHLRTSLAEKEILIKEIHHRVKNNLQIVFTLLDLQSGYIMDEQSLEIFRESKNRIRTIALVHEKLYQTRKFTAIDFNGYLESLADHLFRSYVMDPERTSLEIDAEAVELGIDDAIPCGLIVNELVSNSLKYAFPDSQRGKITIRFQKGDNELIVMTVADNGVGLPPGLDISATETLGLQLVTILARQLRGSIELEREQGTKITIKFQGTGRDRK